MPTKPPLTKLQLLGHELRRLDRWMLNHLWIPACVLVVTAAVSLFIQLH